MATDRKWLAVGITGTQDGATMAQKRAVKILLTDLAPDEVHHGDCVGADEDVHKLCAILGIDVYLHPPTSKAKRAFCKAVLENPPYEYLVRNKHIVQATNPLIAIPRGFTEELRSGTWSTVRYAKKMKRVVYIVMPDGKVITWKP